MTHSRCTDEERVRRILLYKRTVASRYQALRHNELDRLPPGQLHVSPKVDGEFWCASVCAGKTSLIAPNGRELSSDVPVVAEIARLVASRSDDCLIAGELFALVGVLQESECPGIPPVPPVDGELVGCLQALYGRGQCHLVVA